MRVWLLGSGSKGNAVLLESADSRVLIDAGFPPRVLAARLAEIGVAPASIEACVVTHEHTDHVRGAAAAARKWGWSLYATGGTARACPELAEAGARELASGTCVELARFTLEAVPTSHDAADPVAVLATARVSGTRTGVLYDLGAVTPAVRERFRELDMLVLESNHDEGMLRGGPYPRSVQERIASRRGHLSNRAAGAFARETAHAGLNHVVLAHVSENCNDRGLAAAAMRESLRGTRFRGQVGVALQHGVVGPFAPRLSRASAGPSQLELAL